VVASCSVHVREVSGSTLPRPIFIFEIVYIEFGLKKVEKLLPRIPQSSTSRTVGWQREVLTTAPRLNHVLQRIHTLFVFV
jgi:hypothetical protein